MGQKKRKKGDFENSIVLDRHVHNTLFYSKVAWEWALQIQSQVVIRINLISLEEAVEEMLHLLDLRISICVWRCLF